MTRRLGDIIIFEAGDDWVGKSIALLTQSTVSHAAMIYAENTIVEMGPKGILCSRFQEDPAGQKAYLLRLEPVQDPTPLLKAAQGYLDSHVQYDFPDLVILAGLLIYRAIRPTPRWQKITDFILNLACRELDKLLNRILHSGEKVPVMVCSQLVYQCYYDCGNDYRIVLQNPLIDQAMSNGEIVLADLAGTTGAMDALPDIVSQAEPNPETLAQELYTAMTQAEPGTVLETADLSVTVGYVEKFLDLMESILERAQIDLPVQALFVTPGDLLHAANLNQYAAVTLSRVAN